LSEFDGGRRRASREVHGIGDLAVLINPAIEAENFEKLHELSEWADYATSQLPLMMVFSARNDIARSLLFPVMQRLAHPSAWLSFSHRGALLTQALGHESGQITHRMMLRDESSASLRDSARATLSDGLALSQRHRRMTYPGEQRYSEMEEAMPDAFDDDIYRLGSLNPDLHSQPTWVVQTSQNVIDGHSGFFRARFVLWLADVVGEIEARKLFRLVKTCRDSSAPLVVSPASEVEQNRTQTDVNVTIDMPPARPQVVFVHRYVPAKPSLALPSKNKTKWKAITPQKPPVDTLASHARVNVAVHVYSRDSVVFARDSTVIR
jgi:hypothetical protein